MSTPSIQTLRAQAQELLKLVGESPVQQILAISLAQANNGTTPDPDLTTNEYLDLIRTWQHQPASDVNCIIVNQVMRYLANPAGGTTQVFAGTPNPNGYQSATGPAIYLQSDVSPPTEWFKVTSGTSDNEWVSSGGSGGFVSIYSGATVTPQASTWTILDGRVNQVGLDVEATTGTTSITTATGLTLDGSFDLEPIGDTLATFVSQTCTYGAFAPGTLANLSTANLSGSSFDTLDLSGCQNALVLTLNGEISTAFITPLSLYSATIGLVDSPGRVFPPTDFSGSDIAQLTVNNIDFSAGFDITSCASLTSAAIGVCTFASLSFAGCTSLSNLLLNGSTFPTLDVSASTSIVTLGLTSAVFTSVDISGCPSLVTLVATDAVFTSIDASGSSVQTFTGRNQTGVGTQSIDLSGCLSLTTVAYTGIGMAGSVATINCSGCTALTTATFDAAPLTSVNLSGCTSATTVSLEGTVGNFSLNLTNCTSLASLFLANPASGPTEIVSLNLTGCSSLAGVSTGGGPPYGDISTLTTVTVSTLPALVSADFCGEVGAALNVASVNAILVALDANGLSNGAVNLSGGTSAAPTGAGATAKTNLIGKGWVVVTN